MEYSPRVLLDCTAIPANHGGVARYVDGLLCGFEPRSFELTLAVQERDRAEFTAIVPWARVHALPPRFAYRPLRFLWEQLGLPLLALRVRANVVHSPHYTFPLLWRRGNVVTVHDATFFSDPSAHRPLKRFFFRAWVRAAWRTADVVVTPSSATAGEVERFVGAPCALIEVALLGVNSDRFHRPSIGELAAFRERVGLPDDATWFAFLGTIEPRKNLSALLDAYATLRADLGDTAPRLLVSGGRGWDKAGLAKLDALGPDSGVQALGYLPMAQLPALLGGSVAVMYPSLGEGFGLPVLEAMASGAAVITSNRLAIPEVGGNAVAYTEVDAASIAQAMRDLHLDPAEQQRLQELAVARSAIFTWQATAVAHVQAYRAAMRRR